jgi:hypothetical protein
LETDDGTIHLTPAILDTAKAAAARGALADWRRDQLTEARGEKREILRALDLDEFADALADDPGPDSDDEPEDDDPPPIRVSGNSFGGPGR